jgi:hypothetical protein
MTDLPSRHESLFTRLATELNQEYARIQEEIRLGRVGLERGSRNTQLSGYLAEDVWARLLADWLPPQYEFGYRKYINLQNPVDGELRTGEVDLVLFHPAYPHHLRKYREIMISGVSAIFSVKTTLNREDLAAAAALAALLRRGMQVRKGKPIGDLVSPLIVGVLAQSHGWETDPSERIDEFLQSSADAAQHPREELDLLCIADSNSWTRWPMVDIPMYHGNWMSPKLDAEVDVGRPVGTFIVDLWEKLSHRDSSLRQVAAGFRSAGLTLLQHGERIDRPLEPLVDGATYNELLNWPRNMIVD